MKTTKRPTTAKITILRQLCNDIPNHLAPKLAWRPENIAELYRCRWQIEVFFRQPKQTLQRSNFLGASANAVRWQVWTALLVYLLLRYLAFLSNWPTVSAGSLP